MSTYVKAASVLGGLESAVMATLAGGPSYAIPFGVFGYVKSNYMVNNAMSRITNISQQSKDPRKLDILNRNIRGYEDSYKSQNQYFWMLIMIVIVISISSLSCFICFIGINDDEEYKTIKYRRKMLIENPNLTPENIALSLAYSKPEQVRYNI